VEDIPADRPDVYLMLYMSVDETPGGWLLGDDEGSLLRIRFNGATVADDYQPRYWQFYDDNPPEIIVLNGYLRHGSNRVVLRVDPFAGRGLRVRRVELRAHLTALNIGVD